MPQATMLRLVRSPQDARSTASASALTLVKQHAAQVRRVHTLASTIYTNADVLAEALRYFTVAPVRRSMSR